MYFVFFKNMTEWVRQHLFENRSHTLSSSLTNSDRPYSDNTDKNHCSKRR